MEVILNRSVEVFVSSSILHVCGGDPQQQQLQARILEVFSTYVEVIPSNAASLTSGACILHVCGGDPEVINRIKLTY